MLLSRTGHIRQYGSCVLHVGYLRLQIQPQNVKYYCFPLQKWLHEGTSVLRYTYIHTLPVLFSLYSDCNFKIIIMTSNVILLQLTPDLFLLPEIWRRWEIKKRNTCKEYVPSRIWWKLFLWNTFLNTNVVFSLALSLSLSLPLSLSHTHTHTHTHTHI
jgi:hypothetical protein